MTDIFISYSRKDSEFMRFLHGELSKQERDVWVDWEDIPATADWWDEIKTAIEAADAFAFIISPDSVRSDICHDEIQHAINNNKRFIPLLYREITDLDAPYVHSAIRSHNWIPFTNESQYEAGLKKLVDSLSTEPEYVRRHTRLLVRAKEWELQNREDSYLLVGSELNEFLKWLASSQTRTPKPTEIQLEYVYASQNRRNRRNLRIAAGAVSGIILFIVLVAAYLIQQQQFNVEKAAQESTLAAQDAVLTQAKQAQEATSAALFDFQTQVRDNSFAILTQGALEAENADLKSTIVAFEGTSTQSVIDAANEGPVGSVSTDAALSEEQPTATLESALTIVAPTATEAAALVATSEQPLATQVPATPTSEASAQQVEPTNPARPTSENNIAVPPASEQAVGADLFVSRDGNDSNDCRGPRERSCKTVRAAIDKASSGDSIDIAPGVYNENLVIGKDIVLYGADPQATVISGNFEQTVVLVKVGASVELYDMTITGGSSQTFGGGIINNGYLYIENVVIQANSAQLTGGGIANFGELEATDSHVVQNYAPIHPDIYSYPYAIATLNNVDYQIEQNDPLVLPTSDIDGLQVNMLVRIDTTDNDHLRLRERPGIDAPLVTQIENGSLAIITRDGEEHDDYTWWELILETGDRGWAADFVDNVQTIVPLDEYVDVNGN